MSSEKQADIQSLKEGQEKNGYLYAIRLLSVTNRSERELKKRLSDKGYSDSAIDRIVELLKNQKYLNDLALAKQQIDYSVLGNPKGRKRLRFELRYKGLDDNTIDTALQGYEVSTEREIAYEIAERKFDNMRNDELPKRLKRLFDFLARRGFDYDTCREITDKLRRQHENK